MTRFKKIFLFWLGHLSRTPSIYKLLYALKHHATIKRSPPEWVKLRGCSYRLINTTIQIKDFINNPNYAIFKTYKPQLNHTVTAQAPLYLEQHTQFSVSHLRLPPTRNLLASHLRCSSRQIDAAEGMCQIERRGILGLLKN